MILPDFPDECTVNPCQNGGTCSVKEEGGYSCSCPLFYTGLNCEGNNNHYNNYLPLVTYYMQAPSYWIHLVVVVLTHLYAKVED